jgi:hypothetical protein
MGIPKGVHATREVDYISVLVKAISVIPAGLVFLAVGVVVAALRTPQFIPAEQHRHLCKHGFAVGHTVAGVASAGTAWFIRLCCKIESLN